MFNLMLKDKRASIRRGSVGSIGYGKLNSMTKVARGRFSTYI